MNEGDIDSHLNRGIGGWWSGRLIDLSSPVLKIVEEDNSLDYDKLHVDGAVFGEFDTEFVSSCVALNENTVVDVHDSADLMFVAV